MVSRCEREGFDGSIIDLCSDAEDETIRLVRLVADSEEGIMDDVFRLPERGRMTCTGCTSRTTGKKRRNRFERNGLSMS